MRNNELLMQAEALASISAVIGLFNEGVPISVISEGSGLSIPCINRIIDVKPAYDFFKNSRREARHNVVSKIFANG